MKEFIVKVEAVLSAQSDTNFVTSRQPNIEVTYGGIPGDLHFGLTRLAGSREKMYKRGTEIFNRRQLTLVSIEECEEVARKLGIPHVLPEWLGANILVSGYPEITTIPVGSRFLSSNGVGLYNEGENEPCIGPGEIIAAQYPEFEKLAPRFVKAAYKSRGIICSVEVPGNISVGEELRLILA
nr:MOSC domain-containing protein [Brevibacillus daliensis]